MWLHGVALLSHQSSLLPQALTVGLSLTHGCLLHAPPPPPTAYRGMGKVSRPSHAMQRAADNTSEEIPSLSGAALVSKCLSVCGSWLRMSRQGSTCIAR